MCIFRLDSERQGFRWFSNNSKHCLGYLACQYPMAAPGGMWRGRIDSLTAAQPDTSLPARRHLVKVACGSQGDTSDLSHLYDLCHCYIQECQSNHAVTAAAAALVILDNGLSTELVLRQYVQTVFLPLAAITEGTPASSQLLQEATSLLAAKQAWDILHDILQCADSSLLAALHAGGSNGREKEQQQALPCSAAANSNQRWQLLVTIPAATACLAVTQALQATATCNQPSNAQDALQESSRSAAGVKRILRFAAEQLFNTALLLLQCTNAALRRIAFQQLLPALLSAAEADSSAAQQQCMQWLWQQCCDVITRPAAARRMGLAVLLQYWSTWGIEPPKAASLSSNTTAENNTAAQSAAAGCGHFWALLRDCLVDIEPLNRKRALRLLQLLLPDSVLQQQPAWGVFLALYELLDEFSPHLVKATWPLVSQLHPAAPEFANEDAEADVVHSSKIKQVRRPKGKGAGAKWQQLQQQQLKQQQAANKGPLLPLDFCWSSVLWTRALQHSNLQVQRMAMKTLLKRQWTPEVFVQVPVSFVTGVLLPALLRPTHYKATCTAGLSATGGVLDASDKQPQPQQQQQQLEVKQLVSVASAAGGAVVTDSSHLVMALAAQFLSGYVAAAGSAAGHELLLGGLQLAASPGQDLPQGGVLALLRCLAAAAAAGSGNMLEGLDAADAGAFAEAVIGMLLTILGRLQTYRGQNFRCSCYSHILAIAAAAAPAGTCRLSPVARLVQAFPAHMEGPGGRFHQALNSWLTNSSSSSSNSSWLQSDVQRMWQNCFNNNSSNNSRNNEYCDGHSIAGATSNALHWHAGPKDYVALRSSSDAWVRLMLVCGTELQQQLHASMTDLADKTEQLTSRAYLAPGTNEQVLVMLQVLLNRAETAARVAIAAGGRLPPVVKAVIGLAVAISGPLGRCLELYSRCFQSNTVESAAGTTGSSAPRGQAGLSPGAWAAAAQAEAAAQAAAAAALLLARDAAGAWGASAASAVGAAHTAAAGTTGSATQPNRCSLSALIELSRKLADVGEALICRTAPVLLSAAAAAAIGGQAAVKGGLLEAATQEQSRAIKLQVLGHISLGLSRSLQCCPQLASTQLPCNPGAWVRDICKEVVAAQQAHSHWLDQQATASSAVAGNPMVGWLAGMDWKCLDAAMGLVAITANAAQLGTVACDAETSAATYSACQLPVGALPQHVLCSICSQALETLQWADVEADGDLLQLLRCLRRVWVLMVQDEQLQAAAVQALKAAGHTCNSSSSNIAALAAAVADGLLNLLHSSKKRPLLTYSSIINALLLPQLFVLDTSSQPHIVALHEASDAPCKRFVRSVLQQGAKGVPRLMLVLALQLTSFVAAAPAVLKWYSDELRVLVLFGLSSVGVSLEGDGDAQGLLNMEGAEEMNRLAQPLDPALQETYTFTDIGPRIAVCCALHQLAEQAGLLHNPHIDDSSGSLNGACHCSTRSSSPAAASGNSSSVGWVLEAEAAGVALWNSWLQATVADVELSNDRFKVGSNVHRLKVRAWQGLTAAAAFLSSSRQEQAATAALQELLPILAVNNPPSIKQYQEAIVAHLLLSHTTLIPELLLPHLVSLENGNPAKGSHILIAMQTALHAQPEQQAVLLPQVLKLLLPWTNHHTHNIRTFAQLGLCCILDAKPLDSWPGWREGLGPGGIDIVGHVQRFMVENVDFQRFRRAMGQGILSWSATDVTSPRRIFSTALHLAGAEETPVTFEGVPEALMDRLITFLTAERVKLREAAADRAAGYAGGTAAAAAAAEDGAAGRGSSEANGRVQRDFQRKVTPAERITLMADLFEGLDEDEGSLPGPASTQRGDLIVVASLIHKVPNLGGLVRTAEVLGARALVVADKRVIGEPGFSSVSVTAERWVPTVEVKEAELLAWLDNKRGQGYSLVGLEQTAQSRCLPSFKFPLKTVLVLGREKEGIPPEIIAMLDATVEIPQQGVIRSLNVHVSGAIAMYEYVKQQLVAASQ